jgi:branched-chain amino acid transport system ATP-binding protein
MADATLRAANLSKRYGGLVAVDAVSIELEHGAIHCVIGPNGAGKSSLIGLLSGALRPDAGSIRLDGVECAGLAVDRVARLGIARSFQRSNLFLPFTVLENCRLAAQVRLGSSLRFFRPASRFAQPVADARAALTTVGLIERADEQAARLSHGERRQLEIAMTLALHPRVLLLDEPLAGMGADESARMVRLIAELKRDYAVLLVEHDMDAVFTLADRLTVMVNGQVIASGTPAAVRDDAAVQRAYLGEVH